MTESVKAFSFGGGVQSVAALVLAVQGRIDYRTFIFANVGDDSEYPETMRYVREVAIPYAEAHGLELIEVKKTRRDGSTETLWEKLHRTDRSIDIPVRMWNGAPGNRGCTADFKIKPVAKEMRRLGATKSAPGMVGIGTRQDCMALIRAAGLAVPPKSSCFFCPFHAIPVWQDLYTKEPELFQRAVGLEKMINERRDLLGRLPVWLTSRAKPLDQVITGEHENQLSMLVEGDDGQYSCGPFTCDGGAGEPAAGADEHGFIIKTSRPPAA